MTIDKRVQEHYSADGICGLIDAKLADLGFSNGPLKVSDLSLLDQFHARGMEATRELADSLDIMPRTKIIDIGCGLGGPARYLACTFNCSVIGIDISEPFIQAARYLTERVNHADHVSFIEADALSLPFADASFDYGWTQHVAMNISNRKKLYEEIHRVLKPGGRLAIYDVVLGEKQPIIFPVPWARTSDTSFLLNPEEMKKTLNQAGFTELQWEDTTDKALAWFVEQLNNPSTPYGSTLVAIMGSDFKEMVANFARNFREERAKVVQVILKRD